MGHALRQDDPVLDNPQDDEAEIHDALLNWARWCQDKWRPNHAYSAEGRYRPEAGNVHEGLAPRNRIDTLKAEAVNQGLLSVPADHRRVLLFRYYLWMPDGHIAKALGLKKPDYPRFIRDARLMLLAILQANGMPL